MSYWLSLCLAVNIMRRKIMLPFISDPRIFESTINTFLAKNKTNDLFDLINN